MSVNLPNINPGESHHLRSSHGIEADDVSINANISNSDVELSPEFKRNLEKSIVVFKKFSTENLKHIGSGEQTTWFKLDHTSNAMVFQNSQTHETNNPHPIQFAIGIPKSETKNIQKSSQDNIDNYLKPIFLLNNRIQEGLESKTPKQKSAAETLIKDKVQPHIAVNIINGKKVPFGIVSEIMSHGSLDKLPINPHADTSNSALTTIPLDTLVKGSGKALANVCRQIEAFHDLDIIHCDIATRNILVTSNNGELKFKLTDFGLIQDIKNKESIGYNLSPLPAYWAAPESFVGGACKKSDNWSMGITILEQFCHINRIPLTDILTTHLNYNIDDMNELYTYERNLIESPTTDSGHLKYLFDSLNEILIGDKLKSLLLKILKKQPQDRLSLTQITAELEKLEPEDWIIPQKDLAEFHTKTKSLLIKQLKQINNLKIENYNLFWDPLIVSIDIIKSTIRDYHHFLNIDSTVKTRFEAKIKEHIETILDLIEESSLPLESKNEVLDSLENTFPFEIKIDKINRIASVDLGIEKELSENASLNYILKSNGSMFVYDTLEKINERIGELFLLDTDSKSNSLRSSNDSINSNSNHSGGYIS